jgi:hypothetical protein
MLVPSSATCALRQRSPKDVGILDFLSAVWDLLIASIPRAIVPASQGKGCCALCQSITPTVLYHISY